MKPHLARLATMTVLFIATFPGFVAADQPLGTMKVKSFSLTWDENDLAMLRLTGTAEHLGNCACYRELVFVAGEEQGTLDGAGFVAFQAANGDLLVGVIVAETNTDAGTFRAEVHWRDAVTFDDGTTVASSGRFVKLIPPGTEIIVGAGPGASGGHIK
jgi:hypothetical protein